MPDLRRFTELLDTAYELFNREEAVVYLNDPDVMFIGDIHGNLKALDLLLEFKESSGFETVVLLGDYVDRGRNSIAVLSTLFELKIVEPENIVLLRGNHESQEMNLRYGFYQELDLSDELLEAVNIVFEQLPVAAIVNKNIFCVHGGIPGTVAINEISKKDSFEYLWNDPSMKAGMSQSIRGIRPRCFGRDILSGFLQKNGLSLMIRGHSALKQGYKWWFGKDLLSLFSTPKYCGYHNKGAFATLRKDEIDIHTFGPSTYNEQYSLLSNLNELPEW
ncbi:metallophosphoesterase [Methanolobus zinderi]|jgi:serine/threonine-protein phosphatase PP1 catalytic subunit|uniref:Metallophosphoesterase n=1 Tax=Methanolobus zinderi TaxID=536044 RepID=A0A7D5INX6_9EURY|nr:metallophosphoesterase [Methanolobus zinderi]QLC49965.1 metallophosphoesterase [Methanolobus zinderi]